MCAAPTVPDVAVLLSVNVTDDSLKYKPDVADGVPEYDDPIFTLVPTYNFFAIAAPPAVVIVPPFVELVASVVNDIPTPPDNNKIPEELLVDPVVPDIVTEPELIVKPLEPDIKSPTYNFLAMAAPPAVVIVPPFVELVASVANDIPKPPDNNKIPEEFVVDPVVPDIVTAPELIVKPFDPVIKSPIYIFFAIPIPPVITVDAVVVFDASVELVTDNTPTTPNVLLIKLAPVTSKATDGLFLPIPTFPVIINPFVGGVTPAYPIDILSEYIAVLDVTPAVGTFTYNP